MLFQANGQGVVEGIVLDFITKKPIPNVNIQQINESKGTATNGIGIFRIIVEIIPTELIFTHIGYESHFEIVEKINATRLIKIMLVPKVNKLKAISIISSIEEKTLSPKDSYTIVDFEINVDKLYWIEYAGSFNGRIISSFDLMSDQITLTSLDTIKNIEKLEENCDHKLYLLTRDFAYQISSNKGQIDLKQRINLSTYNDYIKPCILRSDDDLIYLQTAYNGLEKNYLRYNIETNSLTNFITISQQEEISQFKEDQNLIKQSKTASNITSNSTERNKKIRDLQKKGDFLEMIYYKPEFDNFLFSDQEQLILLNHIQGRIEKYDNFKLTSSNKLKYIEDKAWMRKVILDKKTERIYTLFKKKNGIKIHEINIDSGDTKFIDAIQTEIYNYENIRIDDGQLYYLDNSKVNPSKLILIKRSLGNH